ncbi:MAG: chemotaxis protein CheW [Azonexus sp.]|nr:chemotaxis protein CheW [Azonexus sp.]MCK6411239.1 chemotaxis protein CheW [Azonexus sp.]
MAIDMTQFYQVFFEESAEHLANMESLLLGLDISHPDPEQLNAIFRAAHSIKGSAGTFGFSDLADTTHILENLLDRIRKQELLLKEEMVDAFLEAGDLLKQMLEAHQGRGEVDQLQVAEIGSRLRDLSTGVTAVEDEEEDKKKVGEDEKDTAFSQLGQADGGVLCSYDIQFVPNEVSLSNGAVASLIDELKSIGTVDVIDRPAEEGNGALGGVWRLRLQTSAAQDKFSEQIDFISDSGAWRIFETSPSPRSDESYGFFDEASVVVDGGAEACYGFFTEDFRPDNSSCADAGSSTEPYGLFSDPPFSLPADSSPVEELKISEEESGYGFFDNEYTRAHLMRSDAISDGDAAPATLESLAFGEASMALPSPVSNPNLEDIPVDRVISSSKVSIPAGNGNGNGHGDGKAARSVLAAAGGESSIRVSVEKVDQLINLVGELVITQAMLLQTSSLMPSGAPEGLANGLAQLERNTRDLQESVMSIRMMPISFVFSRFPRVVRDLSGKLGKQVELKTSGETTELDKGLIERIADPLTHLIRNSLDHGIESPEKRVASGKNPVGTITLKAYHQGGNIVVEVGDDGAGLQRNRILSKARERGMQVSDQMTDAEVFNLIFEAGFSTADQITDVSGRGVGMDVVRRNIQSMGGRVEIDSMPGVGTRITVRLPLTLAILDGMSVAVGDQTYILPLSYVIESLQPDIGDIKTLSNQMRVIQVRGEYLPVVVLHEVFSLKSKWKSLTQGIMVVLEADGAKAALFVDALVGQHQVVIKSLEANYRRVPGISGATIMGDGHVALILDISAIVEMAKSSMQKAA